MSDSEDRTTTSESTPADGGGEPLPRIQPQSPPVPEWSSYGQPRFDVPSQPPHPENPPYSGPPNLDSPNYGPPGSDASATSALPITGAGSPSGPPTGSLRPPSVVGSRADADWTDSSSGPSGAGLAGFLGVVGLTAAAVGLFALPLQKTQGNEVVYANLRHSAASGRRTGPGVGGPSLDSPLGGSLATFWWRYGALIAIAVVALLLALMIAASATRRIGGALLFLGAGAATAAAILAGTQTNDFGKTITSLDYEKEQWQHWQVGAWIGVAGLAVAAFAGLVALLAGLGSGDD